jgi:hypothetical protein
MVNKKITFLINSLGGGGAQNLCVNIANGLAQKGWNVNLLVLTSKSSIFHSIVNEKVNLKFLEISNARYSFKALYNYTKTNKPKKVVVFNYELTVIMFLVRLFCFNKFIIISRNINTISKKKENLKGIWTNYFVFPLIDFFTKNLIILLINASQCKMT